MPHRSTSARPFKNRQRMKIFKNIQGLEGAVDRVGGSGFVTASVRRCDQAGCCRRPQTDPEAHPKIVFRILPPSAAKSSTCLHPAHQCGGLSLGMRSRPSMTKQISVADERRCFRFSKSAVVILPLRCAKRNDLASICAGMTIVRAN
jgi:hypothetical protein